jgi:hypothetical protein
MDAPPPPPPQEASVATKGVWFATELVGKAAALVRPAPAEPPPPAGEAPTSLDEAIRRLESDYAGTEDDPRAYFLTGVMDEALYDEQCEFADPFVSFKGRQRFVDNLSNLAGGFITDASTRMLQASAQPHDATAGTPPSFKTKLLVKLQLGLPWRPVLAWPWGVEHVFDPDSMLIVKHVESWDVSAAEGVRQLLRPGPPDGLKQGKRKKQD